VNTTTVFSYLSLIASVSFGSAFRVKCSQELIMKIQASFVQDGKWWVAWTDDVPGALTQGATLDEARENLIDAVRMIREPLDLSKLPKNKIVIEQIEV
jgi:predicted RNase H-like HicB family nuclease